MPAPSAYVPPALPRLSLLILTVLGLLGLAGGVVGAAWLVTLALAWPDDLTLIDPVYAMPLGAKILYAGITAELVMRLGGMTLVMWLLWRLSGRTDRRPGWMLGWWSVML